MEENLINQIKASAAYLLSRVSQEYHYGVILGSGLGNFTSHLKVHLQIPYEEIPGFPVSTVEGHKGGLIFGELGGKNIVCMNGRFHYYEGYSMHEVTFPIRVMKFIGVHTLMISNAAGGMNGAFEVGDLMVITDHIYLHPEHPLRGKNYNELGPRFPNMSEPYDKNMIAKALEIAKANNILCHTGVYVGLQGPTFETPAEYKWLHIIGGDAVGMSTAPEVVVARHMDMKAFAISVITDVGYPFEKADHVSHEFVLQKAAEAEPKLTTIFAELLKQI